MLDEPRSRPHTGRRPNEASRQAILDASLAMLLGGETAITMDGLTVAAGVGKQTI